MENSTVVYNSKKKEERVDDVFTTIIYAARLKVIHVQSARAQKRC